MKCELLTIGVVIVFVNLYYEYNNELLDFVFGEHSNLKCCLYADTHTAEEKTNFGGQQSEPVPAPLTYIQQSSGYSSQTLVNPTDPNGYELVFGPTNGANNAPGVSFAFFFFSCIIIDYFCFSIWALSSLTDTTSILVLNNAILATQIRKVVFVNTSTSGELWSMEFLRLTLAVWCVKLIVRYIYSSNTHNFFMFSVLHRRRRKHCCQHWSRGFTSHLFTRI